jgi:hypothetical protein
MIAKENPSIIVVAWQLPAYSPGLEKDVCYMAAKMICRGIG